MFKLPGLPSLDSLVNRSPLAQAAGAAGAAVLGVADKPAVTEGGCVTTWTGSSCSSSDIALYDELVHYFKYASTAYAIITPGPILVPVRPNGATLVMKVQL